MTYSLRSPLGLFLLLTTLNAFAATDYIEQWAATQLKFESVIYGEINDKSCLKSQNFFMGCFRAINDALSIGSNEEVVLVSPDLKGNQPLPGFSLKRISIKDKDAANKVKSYYADLVEYFKIQKDLSSIAAPIGFSRMTNLIANVVKKGGRESFDTAMIYNSFLEYAYDPHTSIDPLSYIQGMRGSSEIVKRFGFVYSRAKEDIEKGILVTAVAEGSPAERAGILAGDVITQVNSVSESKEMTEELKKSEVELVIENGQEVRTVKFARAEFPVKTVESKFLEDGHGEKIGYIKLKNFMDFDACANIEKLGNAFLESKVAGIILDLRGNGGGDVRVAKCLMGLFLEKGSKIWASLELETNKVSTERQIFDQRIFKDIYTVILIDGESASASEALSIYLQAYRKAYILGERSFGKGTMQGLMQLPSNSKVILRKTIAKYLGPHGISPQIQGVKPDFEVFPKMNQVEATKFSREENLYENVINNPYKEVPEMPDRTQEIKDIKGCLASDKSTEDTFKSLDSFRQRVFDNQLAVAQNVVKCAHHLEIPFFTGTDIPRYGQKEAEKLMKDIGF